MSSAFKGRSYFLGPYFYKKIGIVMVEKDKRPKLMGMGSEKIKEEKTRFEIGIGI